MPSTHTTLKKLSLTEFLQQPETKPPTEYLEGNIYQKPMADGKHSAIQTALTSAINQASLPQRIARAFTELRCTFTFGNRSIVPDITVFAWHRLPLDAHGEIDNSFTVFPDWTIEILGAKQTGTRLIDNILFCLNQGTSLGWLIDPIEQVIITFEVNQQPKIYQVSDQLLPIFLLPSLQLSVRNVFNSLTLS